MEVVGGGGHCGGGGVHSNTRRPNYLGTRARAQNQRLCHWSRSIGGGLRSGFGASSSSGRGGSGGLRGHRETHHCYSPCPFLLKLTPPPPATASQSVGQPALKTGRFVPAPQIQRLETRFPGDSHREPTPVRVERCLQTSPAAYN